MERGRDNEGKNTETVSSAVKCFETLEIEILLLCFSYIFVFFFSLSLRDQNRELLM